MAETLTVRAPQITRKVVLWERHPTHPNGEIFVVADGKEYEVAKTARVKVLLSQGQLVEAAGEQPAAKKNESKPATPAAPWDGYDAMSAEEVVAQLDTVDAETRAKVLAYEQGKGARGRKTIIDKLVNWNS